MMLTIHGLPVNIKYHDVKMLIKKLCNIDDFILDNLVGDVDGFKKVRIGLANESEGAHLMKCLNGHRVGANVLSVMPVGKVIANAMDQRGGYPPRSDNMPNAPGNYGAQSLPLMGNRSGSWVNTGMPNNQWPQNAPAQSQLPQSSYGYQGPTQSFPQQQTGPLQRPEPRSFGQREVFARPQEQGYGFGPKPNTPVHVQHRPDNRTHVLRSVEIIPSQMRGLTPANYPQQQNYEPNKPVTINKDFFQGSNQYAGGPSGQPGYAPQGSAQPSWNQSVQKPAPFAKHSPFDADRHYPPTDKRSALKDYDKGQSPHEQDSSRGRRVSPHARRVSPHGGRVSPHARRVSPHGGRVSPHARRVSPHASGGPPHEISDSKGRMPDRRNRESPGRRISPGRRTSPGDRRMPGQNSRKRSPTGRQIKSPPRHMRFSPSRRHSDKDFATDRRPPVKQVRPAYEPEVKAPNQAMYAGGGYRPNSHENAPYPLSGSRQIEQRSSTWQQERDNPVFSGGMKKDDDRRDGRMPMGRGSEPILEKRPSPLHKPGSPSRREGRDRSPIRDRYRRHSPSPPSPRRSWALEKRRSPEMHDAPPPPIWPGQNTDDYSRPSRPEFPDRPEKFEKSKQVPAWDKRAFEESNPDARRNHPYEETMRMPREMGVREPMPPGRREPSPRGHGFKSRDARFSPKDNREAKFEPREPKFEPRDPKFVPRDPKFVPRDHKFEPRDPKFEPRDPKFEPRDPKFEPRDPRFEPRGPKFEPRDPKFEPRDPKFEPRDPKFEPRDPKFEPRDPKFDRRERGPQFEPHDPKFAARDPKFEPRDRKFGEPKFEPRDPKFEPRDPKYEPRAPKFEPRNDYKDRREFRRDDVAERKRDFTAREPFDEFERPQSREERRRGEHTREDFRKDDHKYPNEFDIEFEDIFKRTVEFKQRVEELRKPERGRESYEDNRRREPDCEERRKNPDKRERHEDRRGDRHPRDERPASHSDEALKQRDPEWKLQEKPGKRLTLRPSVKVKRDKAIEEISNKMMHKYGDDDMREDLKTRVHEELKLAISRIMQDMFGDQDVSFIELVVKFNSKHNTRDEVKIFKKVMSCLPTQYKNLKRPASDSTDVAAKHTRSSPEPKIKKDIAETSDHVARSKPATVLVKAKPAQAAVSKQPTVSPIKPKAPPQPKAETAPATSSVEPRIDGHYELNPLMSRMLEDELQQIMIQVWQELPDDPPTEGEKLVAEKFRNEAGDAFRNVMGLNVTKRLLNIYNSLNLKVHFSTKPDMTCLKEFLKKYKFVAFKRIARMVNTFAAQLKNIADFDELCSLKKISCGAAKITVTPCYRFTQCPQTLKTIYYSTDEDKPPERKNINVNKVTSEQAPKDAKDEGKDITKDAVADTNCKVVKNTEDKNDKQIVTPNIQTGTNVEDEKKTVTIDDTAAKNVPNFTETVKPLPKIIATNTSPIANAKNIAATLKVAEPAKKEAIKPETTPAKVVNTVAKVANKASPVKVVTSVAKVANKTSPVKGVTTVAKVANTTTTSVKEVKSEDKVANTKVAKATEIAKTNTALETKPTHKKVLNTETKVATTKVTEANKTTIPAKIKTTPAKVVNTADKVLNKLTQVNKPQVINSKVEVTKPTNIPQAKCSATVNPKNPINIKTVDDKTKNTSPKVNEKKPEAQPKNVKLQDKDDYEELDDQDILALISGGIVLDECSGSDDEP